MLAVIDAATCKRDRLLLRVLWATGARISEALALRPMDIQRDDLVLPNRKNPRLTVKRVYLPGVLDLYGKRLRIGEADGVGVGHDFELVHIAVHDVQEYLDWRAVVC